MATAALRGKPPTTVEKRLKAMFFGPAGVGKTTAAIQFPQPYLIDTEGGATNDQYTKMLESKGGAYFGPEQGSTDFEEVIREVTALLSTKHSYRTVIIDPITVPYNDLCDKTAQALAARSKDANSDGTEFGRHKAVADRKVKHLCNLLTRLDMNVIITCHAKSLWAGDGANRKEVGKTFDGYGKLDYLFDLVFEIQKRGKERVGIVTKTRVEAFPESDVFPFTYDEFVTRYGRAILEKDAAPVVLATADQVAELRRLLEILKIDEAIVAKWLDKAGAETFAEMSADTIGKCIAYCQQQVNGKAVANGTI